MWLVLRQAVGTALDFTVMPGQDGSIVSGGRWILGQYANRIKAVPHTATATLIPAERRVSI
jgi:hypothetical protein